MGDVFNMPYKIQVILSTIEQLTAMCEGKDSQSPEHAVLINIVIALTAKLREEIELVPRE